MIHYFLDTSAFVRLYVVEPGWKRLRDMVRGATAPQPTCRILVSEFIHPESVSAIYQIAVGPTAAARGLSRGNAGQTVARMRADLVRGDTFVSLEPTGLLEGTADLVEKHLLKAPDALHLATALLAKRAARRESTEFYFVAADHRLNAAAVAEGLEVIDPG